MVVALKSRCWRCLQPREEGSEQLCSPRSRLDTSAGKDTAWCESIKTTRTGNYGTNSRLASPAGIWERLAEMWKRFCVVPARLQDGDDTARKDQRSRDKLYTRCSFSLMR